MKSELYYTPPKNEIFDELKESAINVWSTYDDTYGYASEKINNIKNIQNVGDNFMYMVAMFDMENQIRLSDLLSEECSKEVRIRMIDSIAEVIEDVRNDMGWDRKTAESWLVDVCTQNNKGNNMENKYTSFLLIQQVTKAGVFVGSNKLKHMTDGMMEMRREAPSNGGGTYMEFTKNRNGEVANKLYFQLTGTEIIYSNIRAVEE